MKAALALLALSLVLASSGCVSDTGDAPIKFSDSDSINLSESGMTVDTSNESINETQEQNLSEQQGSENLTHDPCADKLCDDSVTTCPDGTVVACENSCVQETGLCSSCIPGCAGHEEEPCDIDCGPCQRLDEGKCKCVTEFYCEGNGICTSDEWPEGEDCAKFGGCDDSDKCTTDTFDPNIQECVHVEACCDSGDPCLLGTFDPDAMECSFEYTCCGNALCDQPGDIENCPEECESGEASGDVLISGIDPTGSETVFLEGDSVDMTGWTIEDEVGTTFTFPDGFVIQGIAYLHTQGSPEENNETDLYWGRGNYVWNDAGDTATLKDGSGETVDEYSY